MKQIAIAAGSAREKSADVPHMATRSSPQMPDALHEQSEERPDLRPCVVKRRGVLHEHQRQHDRQAEQHQPNPAVAGVAGNHQQGHSQQKSQRLVDGGVGTIMTVGQIVTC